MNCHLLIPDLFWPREVGDSPYRSLALPALQTLLAQGRRAAGSGASLERWLCDNYDVPSGPDLPLASLSLLADGGAPGQNPWMRADPVSLRPERGGLVLADSRAFSVSAQEAKLLIDALNRHFEQEGLVFACHDPRRWYMRLPRPAEVRTTFPSEAAGGAVDGLLPGGAEGPKWRAFVNEVQMLFHELPLNQERDEKGLPPINSVWLWGAGALPQLRARPFAIVLSDDSIARGLGLATGAAALALSADFSEWINQPGPETLIVLDALRAPLRYRDASGWREALKNLERLWFAPLLEALKNGAVAKLNCYALGARRSLTAVTVKTDLLKFWRRRRTLAEIA